MNWIQRDQYYIESECKRYTVDKVTVDRESKYTAWKRAPKREGEKYPPMPTNLGCFDSAALAKAQCEHDAQTI